MIPLETLLRGAEAGTLGACRGCPWNPQTAEGMDFGVSCREHGFDQSLPGGASSVQVAQDPGGASPGETRRLCFVCNSDRTALNSRALWEAAVACGHYGAHGGIYLRGHYVANAAMHGPRQGTPLRTSRRLEQARERCQGVLAEQIEMLRPRVVIACGVPAAESLRRTGILQTPWGTFRECLGAGAYREDTSWRGLETSVFCTYHAGPLGVSHAAGRHSSRTEEMLDRRVAELEDQAAARAFLDTRKGRGMRLLLLHWLDIGEAIRSAYQSSKH